MKKMTKVLALASFLGISFAAASLTHAQGYYPQNQYGYNGGDPFYQNVYNLDRYGDQMTYAYGQELRAYGGCPNCAALYAEMQRYNACTNNLISAYNGTCPRTFRTASNNVCLSYNRLQSLCRNARMSPSVYSYMNSCRPMVSYVNTNCSHWQPRIACAPRPVVVNNGACNHHNNGGFDLKSAIIGAIAGRIIHGAIRHH